MEDQILDLDQDQVVNEDPIQQIHQSQQTQQSDEKVNWKKMREENERYKKEAAEYKKQLESRGDDDELVERRHLRQMQLELERQTLELRIKNKYADFDDVVSEESLTRLAKEEPELAASINNAPDMYTKAVTAYKFLKSQQTKPEERSRDDYEMWERELDRSHMNPVRSSNELSLSRSERPITTASAFQNGLTKELKAKLYQEMLDSQKNNNY